MTTATEQPTFKLSKRLDVLTAAELGAQGPEIALTPEELEPAENWRLNYQPRLIEAAEKYVRSLLSSPAKGNGKPGEEIGGPRVGPYVPWDVVAFLPIELGGAGLMGEPNKIVPAGSWIVVYALMWANPVSDPIHGYKVPANMQLGGRPYRVTCHQLNKTSGATLPPLTYTGTFPPVLPALSWWSFFIKTPSTTTAELIEVNITADIEFPAQPFAAFATWHYDVDMEMPWFWSFPPPVPPQWRHGIPMQYLVFPQ
ncbi:MAG: hypothetical protein ACUVS4_14090 [Chloroflexaceae bacterium]